MGRSKYKGYLTLVSIYIAMTLILPIFRLGTTEEYNSYMWKMLILQGYLVPLLILGLLVVYIVKRYKGKRGNS